MAGWGVVGQGGAGRGGPWGGRDVRPAGWGSLTSSSRSYIVIESAALAALAPAPRARLVVGQPQQLLEKIEHESQKCVNDAQMKVCKYQLPHF